MKLFLAVFVCASCLQGAAVMRGKLVRNRPEGDPIPGVSVTAPGVANPTLSRDDGTFSLEFPNRQPGDRVRIEPTYAGFEVVNWPQLNAVLARDYQGSNVLIVILARAGAERQEMAARFFLNISERQYQQRLQKACQDKAKLLREREQARPLASQLAQELAKVQPGQASPLYEEAIRLFAEGNVDAALNTLDEAKLRARTQEAKERKEAAEKALRETARDWGLRGSLLATQFRFTEAEAAYRSAIETAPDDFERRFEFALFFQHLNRHQAAREQYEQCLSLARSQSDEGRVALTLNNLGNVHFDQNRMQESRKALEEALAIRRKLAASNPDTYLPYVAATLNNLGNVASKQNKMEEARTAYEERLASYRKLAASNPETYLPDVATTLNNLGLLHKDQNRLEESRKALEEALAILGKLAVSKPSDANLLHVARALLSLGSLRGLQHQFELARTAYEAALAFYRKMASSNPEIYLPYVAATLNNLGTLHRTQNRMKEAQQALEEALAISRKLVVSNSDSYLPHLAQTLNNLGLLYRDENRIEEADKSYDEALQIYRKLTASSPDTYLPNLASTLNAQGELRREQKRMEEALRAFEEALGSYRKLATSNPDTYLPYVARVLGGIGRMHLATQNREQAGAALTEAVDIFSKFAARDPAQYEPFLQLVKEDLAKVAQ